MGWLVRYTDGNYEYVEGNHDEIANRPGVASVHAVDENNVVKSKTEESQPDDGTHADEKPDLDLDGDDADRGNDSDEQGE